MSRRIRGVVGGAATFALLAAAAQSPAVAVPQKNPQGPAGTSTAKPDDRPNAMEAKRRALSKRAAEMVVRGQGTVQERGGSKAVKVAPGQWAQYGVEDTGHILSFLVDFGGAGPTHNNIPEPDRAHDNSTYWRANFDREHYLDMFFKGMPDQNGESFKGVYEEMSSGRYTVSGDVSDWVTVPHEEASYGTTESNTDMTRFIGDSATAWYDAQVAAGKTDAEIKSYLASFDTWDRYDHDGDGDFNEPDGYIDHFQAIHAGEGEEAGAPPSAIWSHRWSAGQDGIGTEGPDGAKFGGVQIGDTGIWISDYTTEPENGGLGVFAHEYGHDLGLPDYYDTNGGDNGTAFWTLMSSGSWMNHGEDAIGTTPNQMGPVEKLQLGWLDYDVARAGESSTHKLGPSFHATKKAQALITLLPKGSITQHLGPAYDGDRYFYSGNGDDRTATTTSPAFEVPVDGQLTAKVNYAIETDWDYAYAEISTDGGTTFTPLETNLSTDTNDNGQNDGHGITGSSDDAWVDLTADLTPFAGQQAQIRFRMVNDAAAHEMGLKVDAISVGSALNEDAEDGAPDWTNDKFVVLDKGGDVTTEFDHYYIAENRQYLGYDQTLAEGAYNFGWGGTDPDKVEHFPYQNGLLVWYWNTFYTDNNTSQHPGGGESLPIDARATALKWSDGTVARSRIQAFDATFGPERTDPISLHREVRLAGDGIAMTTLEVPSQPAISVFDDTDPTAYYDPENPQGSVVVGGTGTTMRVVNSNRNGMMTIKVN